uniref:Cytochrome b n=1 Tax=Blattisocius keegani TaxID=2337216 RepID=A0A4Y5QDB0_9ACAR|nr:cytochrome b [Blattisocius keegani]
MMFNFKKSLLFPLPSNLSYLWNFGSLLGMCLSIQLLTGIFLSMFYNNDIYCSFDSINHINRNVSMGWLIRSFHANGASLFFIMIYMHIGRNIFYKSYNKIFVWFSGIMILLLLFSTSFIGYVLPWGQMSFWGATVITNLLSSIPYLGNMLTLWVWGNFSISNPTLMRFFSLHFLLPFIMVLMSFIHIMFLHLSMSSNPMGFETPDKIPFYPFFLMKDMTGIFFSFTLFILVSISYPYIFMDPDNFILANPLSTPPHIQPEWYFLFNYSILRSIPNKLGGVIALMSSILILFIISLMNPIYLNKSKNNLIIWKILYFLWMWNFIYLSILGTCPIETPYNYISKFSSFMYFLFYFLM